MSTGLLSPYLIIARKCCSKFAATGPEGKLDFCYPGPNCCLLKEDKFCDWFDRAVINSKAFREAGLQQKWREQWEGKPDRIINMVCPCGEEFRPTSPRQKYCSKCRKLNDSKKARLRMRKMRERNKNS